MSGKLLKFLKKIYFPDLDSDLKSDLKSGENFKNNTEDTNVNNEIDNSLEAESKAMNEGFTEVLSAVTVRSIRELQREIEEKKQREELNNRIANNVINDIKENKTEKVEIRPLSDIEEINKKQQQERQEIEKRLNERVNVIDVHKPIEEKQRRLENAKKSEKLNSENFDREYIFKIYGNANYDPERLIEVSQIAEMSGLSELGIDILNKIRIDAVIDEKIKAYYYSEKVILNIRLQKIREAELIIINNKTLLINNLVDKKVGKHINYAVAALDFCKGKYQNCINRLNKAEKYNMSMVDKVKYFELMGYCFVNLGDYDSAKEIVGLARNELKDEENIAEKICFEQKINLLENCLK